MHTLHRKHRSLRQFAPGFYYTGSSAASAASAVPSNNICLYSPFVVGEATRFDRIGVYVVTSGLTSTYRLGLYDSLAGAPSGLLLDAGLVDTSTTGLKEATISYVLPPGLYWTAAVQQGATTNATVQARSGYDPFVPVQNDGSAGVMIGTALSEAGVSGALPTLANAQSGVWVTSTAVLLRAA